MLAATVLGSGMALLDSTVVNVALPSIGREFDAGVAGLQWTANGYLLTLASLVLLGGSLGDRLGRRRVFLAGVVWFAAASLLCGLAPSVGWLVAARMLQGVGAALMTPGSLALLQASFAPQDRGRVIGAWSGTTGLAAAAGPFVGGWLVETFSWRWAFGINVPLAVLVVVVTLRHVPESRGTAQHGGPWHGLDVPGAVLAAGALALVSWGLVAWPGRGPDAAVLGALAAGLAVGAAFVAVEARAEHPMVPLTLFSSRAFAVTNLATLLVYAGLGGVFFVLVVTLQELAGFSPLAAGAALLPVTVVMLALSPTAGALATRLGPRLPMTLGPLVAAAGVAWAARIGADATYLADVVPPVTLLGLGLAVTVTPLTTTVLAAAPDEYAGVASGISNAVARAAGLLAVAALPLLVALDGVAYRDPVLLEPAFEAAMLVCAGLMVAGALVAAVALPRSPSPSPSA